MDTMYGSIKAHSHRELSSSFNDANPTTSTSTANSGELPAGDASQSARARPPQHQQYENVRPVSLGNLLFQRQQQPSQAAAAAVATKPGEGDGELPRSSSPSPSLLSPAASIHSASSYSAPTQRATKVVLPLNDRGVRTRVNILGPPARVPYTASAAAGERQRPASSSSALLLSTVVGSSSNEQPRSSSDSARFASYSSVAGSSFGDPRRFSSLSHINQTTSASAGHPVFNMISAANRRVIPEHVAPSSSYGRSAAPAVASEPPYQFPVRPPASSAYGAGSSGPQTPEPKYPSAFTASHSSSSSSASNHPFTPSGPTSGGTGTAATTGAGYTSVYSTPASSVSRPSPNASFSYSNNKSHLQNLPRSLIPGGYDFSPASGSTHESHAVPVNATHSREASVPFSYMRDRSASVPRTVSSLGESERSSSEDFHRQFLPAAVNGSERMSHNDSGHGNSSGADASTSTFTTVRQGRDSQESDQGDVSAFTMPQISPVPPKLDLDFGSFGLDFGSSFGSGSLDLGSSLTASKPVKGESTSTTDYFGSFSSALAPVAAGLNVQMSSQKTADKAALGLGFPPRRPSIPDVTSKSPPLNVAAPPVDEDDAPLASLAASRSGPIDIQSAPAISDRKLQPHGVESILEMAPKAISPLTRLARSASNSSSLTDLTSLTQASGSLAHGNLDEDRTPKASSATQMTFTRPIETSSTLAPERPQTERSRSESPASGSGSSMEPSRPASSLLVHHPQQQHALNRHRLDSLDHSGSKRTTLSSYEQHGQSQMKESPKQASLLPTSLLNAARLSMNKNLPAIPGLTLETGSATSLASSLEAPPVFRRSVSESVLGASDPVRPSVQERVASKGSRESQHSTTSTSSSLDIQPLHQLALQQSRSRANTLDLQLNGSETTAHRGPHGSAASHTMQSVRMELTDLGEKATREHPVGPRGLAKPGVADKQRTRKYDVWDNGELVKKDPATDKLLASVVEKLIDWMATSAYQAREKIIALPDEPIRPSLANMAKPSSALLPTEQSATVTTIPLIQAEKAVLASAEPLREAKAQPVSIGKDSAPRPTPASSMPSSLVDKPPLVDLHLSSQLKKDESARFGKPRYEPGQSETTPEVVAPLRLNSKTQRPPSASAMNTMIAPARKTGGEIAFTTAWTEIEASLHEYRTGIKLGKAERAACVQTGFLPKFKQEELNAILSGARLSKRQKELLFDWIDLLFEDLQGAPANRGACLDGIATVIESRLMNYFAFESDESGRKRLQQTIASLLYFAIDKLNGKAIFANTLGFAGKMLAAAFWHLEGVALKLLRLLPAVKKQHLLRISKESGIADCPGKFPPHLAKLQYTGNAATYMLLFPPVRPGTDEDAHLYSAEFDSPQRVNLNAGNSVEESDTNNQRLTIEMAGNWLIRWTATDSDLPFAFMRAYHRQLSNYLPPFEQGRTGLPTAHVIKAPGYIFVMGCLLEVCDALIHRNLRSVTTMAPSNTGVNANESANLAAGQKPKALEVVSKRVVQTIFEVVGGLLQPGTVTSTPQAYASAALRHNFGCSLQVWIAAVTKRTSMYDTRGIFALLDLIEGLIFNICSPPVEPGKEEEEDEVWQPSEVGLALFDMQFILSFIKTILGKADNTTCLLRTISFLYTEFASFTLRSEDREELCDRILLDPFIFNRLFLYYNVGVRGYFLRLLVYRLARLGTAEEGKSAWSIDPRIVSTLRSFEARLEKIRKRHDELDPYDDEWDSEDSEDEFRPRPKRSTICSTWGVHDQPWAIDLTSSRKPSFEATEEERQAEVSEQNATVEAIEEPQLPLASPPLLMIQSANSSTTTLSKANKLAAAKKAAGGWWNNLKNRKVSNQGKGKAQSVENISPFEDSSFQQSSTSGPWHDNYAAQLQLPSAITHNAKPAELPPPPPPAQEESQIGSMVRSNHEELPAGSPILPPQVPEFLKVDTGSPRLRKSSSRKSLRRGPSAAGTAATPSRSRRSSMYSFDLDVNTPRSDAFDFPMSPMSATAGSPISPSEGNIGALSLSPVAFSALMDGNIAFNNEDQLGSAPSPSRPRHQRGKSASSLRKSRPTSVISERGGPSPRVSKRFSKRASILPPPALDLLKESPSEPVPKIPEQYKTPTTGNTQNGMFGSGILAKPVERPPSPPPYEQKQHAYAVRGLREYEDCLDEWELFVHRAKEEEGADGKELNALIPRLQCAWPSTWEE